MNWYFYIPRQNWPPVIPADVDRDWAPELGHGMYTWPLQTHCRLRAAGFPCTQTDTLPQAGVVLAYADVVLDTRFCDAHYVVCMKGDRAPRVRAHMHVVQSRSDELFFRNPELWKAYYIPFWPQPGLLPRSADRGDKFENIVFMGRSTNLLPEFQTEEWRRRLEEHGFRFRIKAKPEWHDYRDVDGVLAVRVRPEEIERTRLKPASKLVNAWLAGVPALLGPEYPFQELRESPLDYIEVTDCESALRALLRLREAPDLRRRMVAHGRRRAEAFTVSAITARWIGFLEEVVRPEFERWSRLPRTEKVVYKYRKKVSHLVHRIRNRIERQFRTASKRALKSPNTPSVKG